MRVSRSCSWLRGGVGEGWDKGAPWRPFVPAPPPKPPRSETVRVSLLATTLKAFDCTVRLDPSHPHLALVEDGAEADGLGCARANPSCGPRLLSRVQPQAWPARPDLDAHHVGTAVPGVHERAV